MGSKRERGTGYIYLPKGSNVYWCQYPLGKGKRIRTTTEEREPGKAKRFLKDRVAEVRCGIHKDTRKLTYEAMRHAYYQDYKKEGCKSLRFDKDGHPHLDKVCRLDAFFERMLASDINRDQLKKFIEREQERGMSNGSICRSLSALRRMFHIAVHDEKFRDVPSFRELFPKEAPARKGFFERQQYEALLAVLPDYLRLVFGLGYFTGMRLGEILGLNWDQIDLLRNSIRLLPGTTKNDEGRVIPIVPELRSLILERRSKRIAEFPYVCFRINRVGNPERIAGFRKAWQRACVLAGLGRFDVAAGTATRSDRPNGKPKGKRVYRGKIFHDLRRSAVRNLVHSGTPETTAMKISGHLTREVFDRYNIVSETDVMDAGKKLAEFHRVARLENSHSLAIDDATLNRLTN
jgi:integrase